MEETVGLVPFCVNIFVRISFLPFFKVFVSEKYYICGTYHMGGEKIYILA